MIQTSDIPNDRVILEAELRIRREIKRRLNMPINQYVPDNEPGRRQLSFHESPARYRLGFGGNRAGKSVTTAYEAAAWARGCHRFQEIPPGPKEIYVISAEYRTIYHGIYRHVRPDGTGKAMRFLDKGWIKQTAARVPGATVPLPAYIQVWCETFADGTKVPANCPVEDRPYSTIWFISGDGGEQARKKLQAAAVDLIIIDEEIEQSLYEELQMRILDSDGRICVSATLVRSEDWLMALEDRAEEGDRVVFLVRLSTIASKHISENAKKDILSGLTPEEYAVRVEGKSRRQFGLVYPEFGVQHTFSMAEAFPDGFPPDWPIVQSCDPGFRTFAALWCAVDVASGTLYFFRELYMKEAMLEEVCRSIADAEGHELVTADDSQRQSIIYKRRPNSALGTPESPTIRLIDPAGFNTLQDGSLNIATQMAAYYDTPVAPANNNLHSGIESARKLLSTNPNTNRPHALFDENLKNFFSERRKYRLRSDTSGRNAHATKAEPIRKYNHLMDTFRYLCTYATFLLAGHGEGVRQRRGHSIEVPASIRTAERLEKLANAVREREKYANSGNSWLGSEW